jgi:hypothetical protein
MPWWGWVLCGFLIAYGVLVVGIVGIIFLASRLLDEDEITRHT